MAGAIVSGENLAESMKSLIEDMVKSIISQLIKMGIQWVISSLIARKANLAQTQSAVTNNAATAATGAAASQAGIPIIGPILAIAAMAAMLIAVTALSGGLKLAKGGITTGPTRTLIGEAGPEAIIPLSRLSDIIGPKEQTITIELNGRVLTQEVIKNMPREIRLRTGVLM